MSNLIVQNTRLTVVTVCYNASSVIAKTLESVIGQTYPNIEYIIIDGGSTDGTQDIIKKYLGNISCFISEPDNGTYDAMNKAIARASGEWISFINAGDYYFQSSTISEVFANKIDENIDFIYGDYVWKSKDYEVKIPSRPLDLMWQKISFSHQSLITRTRLMKEKKFDLSFDIASDYNFYFSSYMNGSKFHKLDFPISVFIEGGLSDVCFFKRTYERWRIVTRFKNELKVHFFYIKIIFDHYYKNLQRKIYNGKK